MLLKPLLIHSSATFWQDVARALLHSTQWEQSRSHSRDMSALRVIVPTFAHIQLLTEALAEQINDDFIPPRINTLSAWLDQLPPTARATSQSERLMALYGELRQHGWLKKLFTARRNTDLLPLAQTLLKVSDELTLSLLPAMQREAGSSDQRWEAALATLPTNARHVLSDEAQLVWTIWKSQLDGSDALAMRHTQMMQLAERAQEPLVWISPLEWNPFEQALLQEYGRRQIVMPITLNWHQSALPPLYAAAWPELIDETDADNVEAKLAAPNNLSLSPAKSLEQEAQQGAQTIIDWLQSGKSQIAIIAQDRVVARRLRALLERAQVVVSDETGWKLSTTRAAAAIVAWFDVIASRAETIALLDLLKSPFLFTHHADKTAQIMAIEMALRSANVSGGWEAVNAALCDVPQQAALLKEIVAQANRFVGRKTLADWIVATNSALDALEMRDALTADAAGAQVLLMLDAMVQDCEPLTQAFSFPEWRAFVSLQLEATAFVAPNHDRRVTMLPLNGARLRRFDAVLMVGADADHLPSQPSEVLFFANAVRRELGLATRESQQREQLRDFVDVLNTNQTVVLSWQAHKEGEANPVSPWIERLQLTLARSGNTPLLQHTVVIAAQSITATPAHMPTPTAAQLLPRKLSPSGYNSLVACPYQFFATRMLGLSGLDELSDMPEKRDYGDWLHRILNLYHETVREKKTATAQRAPLLADISEKILGAELEKNAGALAYYARWQKVMPAYLDWANEREAQGWQFEVGEQWMEKPLIWQDGAITLNGRVDRIDVNVEGERAVLDYKTQNPTALRAKIKLQEDHQLAFYGLLSEQPIDAAHYVALELTNNKTADVAAPNYAQWRNALEKQIQDNMQAVAQGAELPATGIESVCQYCEVRGMCRKGAW